MAGIKYEVDDPYSGNIERMQYGIPKGAIISANAGLTGAAGSESYTVLNSAYVIASNGNKENAVAPDEATQDIKDIDANEDYYIFLDGDTPTLKLMYYDTESLENMPYWRDVGSGNTDETSSWTSIGTVTVAAESNRVTGTGFNSNVELRDILNLSNNTAAQNPPGRGAEVIGIVSDTELIIDRTFDSSSTSITGYRSNYRPDYADDAAIARVSKNDSDTFSVENFLVIDPGLVGSKSVVVDLNVTNLTYDSAGTQTNVPTSITATVFSVGFIEPEFKAVIPSGMSAAGTVDFAVSTDSDNLQKTFTLDDNGGIAYSSGSNLSIEFSVREKNDTDTVKTVTYVITKTAGEKGGKGEQGPQGEKGPQGNQGAVGDKGSKGDKGLKGIQGPQGDTGTKGEVGEKGLKEYKALKGIQAHKVHKETLVRKVFKVRKEAPAPQVHKETKALKV